jgi:glycosyltransferase involved in cell wall biosynthesis
MNASRLVHQKANDDTVRALALLPEHVKLILIGEGEDEPMLKDTARELGVDERVIFVGRLERTEVPKYRNRDIADIYVTPSRSEGLQLSSLSALAARIPLIATQEGGLAEYVFGKDDPRGQTAWVVRKDAPEEIADAVKDILEHPETVRDVVERSYAMVFENYNWDTIAKQMRDKVFAKVL